MNGSIRGQRTVYELSFPGTPPIDASLRTVHMLSQSPKFHPVHLAVRFAKLVDLADVLPAPTRAHVTHLIGYFPNRDHSVLALEAGLANLFDSMPALTHIALEVLSLSRGDSDNDSDWDVDEEAVNAPLDLDALGRTLLAALKHSRIQAVALRVAAEWQQHWPAVRRVAEQLKDARLSAWHDTRPITSWAREAQFSAADAWAGRVWHPDAGVTPLS